LVLLSPINYVTYNARFVAEVVPMTLPCLVAYKVLQQLRTLTLNTYITKLPNIHATLYLIWL